MLRYHHYALAEPDGRDRGGVAGEDESDGSPAAGRDLWENRSHLFHVLPPTQPEEKRKEPVPREIANWLPGFPAQAPVAGLHSNDSHKIHTGSAEGAGLLLRPLELLSGPGFPLAEPSQRSLATAAHRACVVQRKETRLLPPLAEGGPLIDGAARGEEGKRNRVVAAADKSGGTDQQLRSDRLTGPSRDEIAEVLRHQTALRRKFKRIRVDTIVNQALAAGAGAAELEPSCRQLIDICGDEDDLEDAGDPEGASGIDLEALYAAHRHFLDTWAVELDCAGEDRQPGAPAGVRSAQSDQTSSSLIRQQHNDPRGREDAA